MRLLSVARVVVAHDALEEARPLRVRRARGHKADVLPMHECRTAAQLADVVEALLPV